MKYEIWDRMLNEDHLAEGLSDVFDAFGTIRNFVLRFKDKIAAKLQRYRENPQEIKSDIAMLERNRKMGESANTQLDEGLLGKLYDLFTYAIVPTPEQLAKEKERPWDKDFWFHATLVAVAVVAFQMGAWKVTVLIAGIEWFRQIGRKEII